MQRVDEINFKTVFPNVFEADIHQINRDFNMEIHNLIENEISNVERTFVYIVERRGLNLFLPFVSTIKKFHEMGTIRLYDDKKLAGIKEGANNSRRECIIITDAIRKGEEISIIVDSLNKLGIEVLKVCGYLSNKETIENLRNMYADTKFKFIHEVTDYSQYKEYYGKTAIIHHKRLEPLDSEHPYYMYKFKNKIGRDKIETLIWESCKKANISRDQDLINNDITGYSAEFNGDDALKSISLNTKNDFFEIDRLLLRFRFDKSKSELRIMAFCDVNNFNLNKINLMDDYIEEILPGFIRYCNFLNDISSSQKVVCPLCTDINLSRTFLDKYDYKIKRLSENKGFFLKIVKKFDPFLNY